jgi:hypothetical protein
MRRRRSKRKKRRKRGCSIVLPAKHVPPDT